MINLSLISSNNQKNNINSMIKLSMSLNNLMKMKILKITQFIKNKLLKPTFKKFDHSTYIFIQLIFIKNN